MSSNSVQAPGSPVQDPPRKFVSALEHFFSIASFYPVNHSRCLEVAKPFMLALEEVAQGQEGVTLAPGPEDLLLNQKRLRPENQGVAFFQQLLGILGVQRMELPRDLTIADLHQTVRALNQAKLKAESSASLSTLRLQDLPASIKVVQREFGRGRFKLGGHVLTSELGGKLDELADSIQETEWSDEKKEEFRRQTQAFLARTIERMDRRPEAQHAQDHRTRRSLEEVLLMGANALSHAIRQINSSGVSPNLQRLFRNAADSLAMAADTDSVDLILEVMNETVGMDLGEPEEDLTEQWVRDDTVYAHPVAELARRLPRAAVPEITPELMKTCLAEEKLSMQMALLGSGAAGPWAERLAAELAAGVDRPQNPAIQERLINAVGILLDGGDRRPIDHLLPQLLPGLSRFAGERLATFLHESVGVERTDRLALIWPHLVALLLLPKAPTNTDLRKALVLLISGLPAAECREEAHRLDYLESVRRGPYGAALFHLPLARTRQALQALLAGRQSPLVVQRLQESWQARPPHPQAALAGRILGEFNTPDRSLYQALLEGDGQLAAGSAEAREFATRIQARVSALKGEQREAAWVPEAIAQLGLLGHEAAAPLLEKIQKEKKLGLLASWPQPCREQATRAQTALREGGGA